MSRSGAGVQCLSHSHRESLIVLALCRCGRCVNSIKSLLSLLPSGTQKQDIVWAQTTSTSTTTTIHHHEDCDINKQELQGPVSGAITWPRKHPACSGGLILQDMVHVVYWDECPLTVWGLPRRRCPAIQFRIVFRLFSVKGKNQNPPGVCTVNIMCIKNRMSELNPHQILKSQKNRIPINPLIAYLSAGI